MFMGLYLLDGRRPVPCLDLNAWSIGFETLDRTIARTDIGNYQVSTVFLGIDHNFGFSGTTAPILFETMVFEGEEADDHLQLRYETWEQAEAGHAQVVAALEAALSPVPETERRTP